MVALDPALPACAPDLPPGEPFMFVTQLAESPQWAEPFLHHLARHGLITKAAAAVGTTKKQVRMLMEQSIEFEAAVEEALETATDEIELAARNRAVHGVEKSIFYKGEECGVETVYSDSLAALFLKAKRRGQFGDKTELSGPGGTPLTVNVRSFPLPDGAPAGHDGAPALDAAVEAILLPAAVPASTPDDFV